MVAARSRHPAAGLFRAALLAAVLAVLAGLLGMHVISGSHNALDAHASAAVEHSAAHTAAPPSCGCGGDCGDQPSAHVSCTPAPSGASLSAPPPGGTLLAVRPRTAPVADPATAYSYLPATPTPNELSISRT